MATRPVPIPPSQQYLSYTHRHSLSNLDVTRADGAVVSWTIKARNEVPAGVIDGANASFTVLNLPVVGTMALYLNGLRMRPTTDYAVAGNIITYVAGARPQAGDNHLADYEY